MWPPFLKSRFGGQGAYWTRLWPEGSKGSEGSGGRFLGLTGPMGRRVLKFDGPLARGLWYRPAGDEFYKPPAAVTSTSSIIIRITTVHPFATSWPSSPKGDARTLRDWLSVSYVTQYPVPPIFSFPLEGKSREAGKGVRGRAPIGCSIAVLTANRRPPERSDAQPFYTTLGTEGQRPDGCHRPLCATGAGPFGNTEKHRPGPDPDRATGAPPPPFEPFSLSVKFYSVGEFFQKQ